MKKFPKPLILLASLSLLLLFLLPLWRITLEAPQYPEGISMYIWINKITGDTEYTLQNINILNHYIGMQYIEPDSIRELKYFPMVVILLVLFGIIAAWSSSRYFRLSWLILLVMLAALGVYDFYLWEYDYGHNLSPNAPIKVPGMVYQPPLFGSKMLLNFNATSYPHWGGIILMFSILLACVSCWRELSAKRVPSMGSSPAFAGILLLVCCLGCSRDPQPIDYGNESCEFCMMTIVDKRFGSEIITDKGKPFKFDSIECMINYLKTNESIANHLSFVTAYDRPNEELIESNRCTYLIDSNISSPMGRFLSAFGQETAALNHQQQHGGRVLSWNELLDQFDKTTKLD